MEAFILVGCFLSLPIIYYSTRPYTPAKVPFKPHSDMEDPPVQEEQPTEAQMQVQVENARKRKERVMSTLTPEERVLVQDYFEALKDPVKRKEMAKYQKLDCLMGTVVLVILAGGVYLVATTF